MSCHSSGSCQLPGLLCPGRASKNRVRIAGSVQRFRGIGLSHCRNLSLPPSLTTPRLGMDQEKGSRSTILVDENCELSLGLSRVDYQHIPMTLFVIANVYLVNRKREVSVRGVTKTNCVRSAMQYKPLPSRIPCWGCLHCLKPESGLSERNKLMSPSLQDTAFFMTRASSSFSRFSPDGCSRNSSGRTCANTSRCARPQG